MYEWIIGVLVFVATNTHNPSITLNNTHGNITRNIHNSIDSNIMIWRAILFLSRWTFELILQKFCKLVIKTCICLLGHSICEDICACRRNFCTATIPLSFPLRRHPVAKGGRRGHAPRPTVTHVSGKTVDATSAIKSAWIDRTFSVYLHTFRS